MYVFYSCIEIENHWFMICANEDRISDLFEQKNNNLLS